MVHIPIHNEDPKPENRIRPIAKNKLLSTANMKMSQALVAKIAKYISEAEQHLMRMQKKAGTRLMFVDAAQHSQDLTRWNAIYRSSGRWKLFLATIATTTVAVELSLERITSRSIFNDTIAWEPLPKLQHLGA